MGRIRTLKLIILQIYICILIKLSKDAIKRRFRTVDTLETAFKFFQGKMDDPIKNVGNLSAVDSFGTNHKQTAKQSPESKGRGPAAISVTRGHQECHHIQRFLGDRFQSNFN